MLSTTDSLRACAVIGKLTSVGGALLVLACGGSESRLSASGGASSQGTGTSAEPSAGGGKASKSSGGGASTGGTSTGGASTGDASTGGASTGDASGGTETPVGTISKGGSSAKGGATSAGGSSAKGGATSAGGSSAKGGAISSGGQTTGGANSDLCSVGVWDGKTKPVPLTLSGNTFAHDPTMIAINGSYYRFWTGDNIPSAKSTNLTNWQNAPAVFTNGYSPWVSEWLAGIPGQTFGFPWAPDISFFNGKYHIYSAFSAKFGDNISCITHLSTSDIAVGNWTDHGPVICTKGNENYNAIDADVGVDTSGTAWLAFGSFWNGIMGFPLNPDGTRAGTTLTRLAWAGQIEAPVLFYRCGYYYLFVTWGLCCPGEGRTVDQLTYRVAVGRAPTIMGPYVDKAGKAMLDGGGTLMVQGDHVTWAAAGHSDVMVSGSKIYHLYHAYLQSNGNAQLRIVEMPFDSDGWPVPAGP